MIAPSDPPRRKNSLFEMPGDAPKPSAEAAARLSAPQWQGGGPQLGDRMAVVRAARRSKSEFVGQEGVLIEDHHGTKQYTLAIKAGISVSAFRLQLDSGHSIWFHETDLEPASGAGPSAKASERAADASTSVSAAVPEQSSVAPERSRASQPRPASPPRDRQSHYSAPHWQENAVEVGDRVAIVRATDRRKGSFVGQQGVLVEDHHITKSFQMARLANLDVSAFKVKLDSGKEEWFHEHDVELASSPNVSPSAVPSAPPGVPEPMVLPAPTREPARLSGGSDDDGPAATATPTEASEGREDDGSSWLGGLSEGLQQISRRMFASDSRLKTVTSDPVPVAVTSEAATELTASAAQKGRAIPGTADADMEC